jgi:uncharacterized membrane protein
MTEKAMNKVDNVGAATFGTVMGLITNWLALIPTLPAWLTQACVTLFVSGAALVINHFVKRELNRRWPERKRRKGDTGD